MCDYLKMRTAWIGIHTKEIIDQLQYKSYITKHIVYLLGYDNISIRLINVAGNKYTCTIAIFSKL